MAGLIIAALAGTLLAVPASAAKPAPDAKAPSFAVTLNKSSVGGWLAPKVYLAFTFTSTGSSKKTTTGFARFVTPSRTNPSVVGNFGWQPALQQTDPLARGYFRVEATTCASATVSSFTPTGDGSEQSIDIAFDCQPGQAFVLHWFPTSQFYGFDGNNEIWHFPVSTRFKAKDAWTPQTPPQLQVDAVNFTNIINVPFITPPLALVNVTPVITDPTQHPTQILLTGDAIALGTTVTSTITIDNVFRADTGAPLVIVNADDLRMDRTIQVVGCLDLNVKTGVDLPPGVDPYNFDCAAMDNNVLQIDNPAPGAFQNADGTLLTPETAVIAGVFDFLTAPSSWKAAESRCLFRGGVYFEHPLTNELWNCVLPAPAPNNDRYYFVLNDLAQAEYCPTGKIRNDPTLVERQIIACLS